MNKHQAQKIFHTKMEEKKKKENEFKKELKVPCHKVRKSAVTTVTVQKPSNVKDENLAQDR